jgi:hypothetical protein
MKAGRRLRTSSVSLIAVVLLAAVVGLSPAAASADSRFGINAQVLFWSTPQQNWAQHVQMMRQDGIQVVRADALWNNAEPNAPSGGTHTYYWTTLDAIEAVLAANSIRWQPIVDYSTPWSASARTGTGAPNLYSPPANNADFTAYAQALVRRYGPNGTFWSLHPELTPLPVTALEVWNEENTSNFWAPQPNAAAYASLYAATRSAIHAVDPTVQAIVGGLSNPSTSFLQGMYTALGGTSGNIDAVGIHPYGADPKSMYYDVVDTRAVLEQHGDVNVPIDVTEFGWPTGGLTPGMWTVVSDAQRAQYVQQFTTAVARSNCGVDRIEPHTWVTREQNLFDPEDYFGFVHPNATRTTTESTYSSTIGQLAPLATPSPPAASTCSQQLGVPANTARQPPPPPPLLPPLPPLGQLVYVHVWCALCK